MPYKEQSGKHFLICYDIACKKRLAKVQRLIGNHAIPIQRSVYFATLRVSQMDDIIAQLKPLLTNKDSVNVYETQALEKAEIYGNRSALVRLFGENGDEIHW
ncbi:MAG: CRISPR-associated endonuclease Cas2 [Moraxella sp.]|nr:CRISPR-associated endonuclease Cas2 [Moraxella sp.]